MDLKSLKYVLIALAICPLQQVRAQNFDPVPVWSIYLDLTDEDAREAASSISKAGFSRYIDERDGNKFLVLNTGDISHITEVINRRRRDGIKVVERDIDTESGCLETILKRDSVIQFKSIRNNFYNQFYLQLPDHTPPGNFNTDGSIEKRYYKEQEKKFKKFIKGKIRSNPFKEYYWLPLGTPLGSDSLERDISYVFFDKKKELVTLRFDSLPGRNANKLEAFEDNDCVMANRFSIFREQNGQGPGENYFRQYRPRGQFLFGKEFTVKFEKNRASYSRSDINSIIQFINDSSYSIVSAAVEGYASVEGTFENNQKLMEQRAGVLLSVLEQSNDESIGLDTLIVSENWDKFYEQIENTRYSYLLNIPKDSAKVLLTHDSLANALEPFLAEQRKAILNLKLSQKLNPEEKAEEVFKNYYQYSSLVKNPSRNSTGRDFRPVLMGILQYIENMVREGLLTPEEAERKLPPGELLTDLRFQKLKKDVYLGNEFSQYTDIEKILLNANELYTILYASADPGHRKFIDGVEISYSLLDKLVDIQFLSMDLVKRGYLENDFLCKLTYPEDSPRFYPLILNLLEYDQEDTSEKLPCFKNFDAGSNSDLERGLRMYKLHKKIVLEGDAGVLNFVYRKDNLFEFDLYSFLKLNISKWDPESGYLFDEDVGETTMRSQLRRLRRVGNRLCSWLIDQLFLDYNLKVVQKYLYHGLESKADEAVLTTSFNYLKRYFLSRAAIMDEERAVKVCYQFIRLNHLYLTRDGSEAAYDLLHAMKRRSPLNGEAARLYMQLAYYHNPGFLSLLNDNPPLDICTLFKGKFSLYPYGKIKDLICSGCY